MALSPEEQYHQNISNNENEEDVYAQSTNKIMPVPMSIPRPAPEKKQYVKYKVLLKQGSQLNKKIINYFKQNLSILNQSLCVFEWIAVYDEEIEYYDEQGIDKFPALILGNNNTMGITNIIQTLDNVTKTIKTISTVQRKGPQTKKETEEEMHEFLLRELKSKDADKEDDEQDSISNTISQRVSTMNKSRADNGLHAMGKSSTIAESDSDEDIFVKTPALAPQLKKTNASAKLLTTSELIKATTKGDDEDKMMSQFWQNQEETEM